MYSKVKDKIHVHRRSSELIYVCYGVDYMVVEELGGAKADNYTLFFYLFSLHKIILISFSIFILNKFMSHPYLLVSSGIWFAKTRLNPQSVQWCIWQESSLAHSSLDFFLICKYMYIHVPVH